MTSSQAKNVTMPSTGSLQRHETMLKTWARTRKWSRTDSGRFLNDRSEALLARFRRVYPAIPVTHTSQIGYWLKEHAPALFDRAHLKLSACADDAARERLLPSDLL